MVSGFGRVQKNIIFNRFREMTDWRNCLSFNQMAGNLFIYNIVQANKAST